MKPRRAKKLKILVLIRSNFVNSDLASGLHHKTEMHQQQRKNAKSSRKILMLHVTIVARQVMIEAYLLFEQEFKSD